MSGSHLLSWNQECNNIVSNRGRESVSTTSQGEYQLQSNQQQQHHKVGQMYQRQQPLRIAGDHQGQEVEVLTNGLRDGSTQEPSIPSDDQDLNLGQLVQEEEQDEGQNQNCVDQVDQGRLLNYTTRVILELLMTGSVIR